MGIRQFHFLIILLAFPACTTIEDCQNDPNRDFLIIRFEADGTVSFDSVYIDGSYSVGEFADITTLTPYLDKISESISFVFFTDSIDYELEIGYEKQIQIFEIDCDPSYSFFNLDSLYTNADSLVISINPLTYSSETDVTVYF